MRRLDIGHSCRPVGRRKIVGWFPFLYTTPYYAREITLITINIISKDLNFKLIEAKKVGKIAELYLANEESHGNARAQVIADRLPSECLGFLSLTIAT